MKIVVVGGGFGGVKTALELSNKDDIEVILISERPNFEYHGALYRSGTGRSPLEVVIPLREILQNSHHVTFSQDKIVGIDDVKQRVIGETGEVYSYDKLVLAMGNVVNYFGIKGMGDMSMSLDTIANTIALRIRLTELFKNSDKPANIAVIGAGPAGVELAGELKHFAQLVAARYDTKPVTVNVSLIEGASRVLPTLLPVASEKALKRLKALGLKVMLKTQVNSCEPGKVCLNSGDLHADLIVWTAGSRATGFYAEHTDIFELERGKVRVNQYLCIGEHKHIFVIGDNAATPYSGMAQTALHDAKFVAANILREQAGQQPQWYQARRPIYAVPIGPNWAILQTTRRVISGRRAWAVRRRADLAIYRNFEPYKQAIKTYRSGHRLANF